MNVEGRKRLRSWDDDLQGLEDDSEALQNIKQEPPKTSAIAPLSSSSSSKSSSVMATIDEDDHMSLETTPMSANGLLAVMKGNDVAVGAGTARLTIGFAPTLSKSLGVDSIFGAEGVVDTNVGSFIVDHDGKAGKENHSESRSPT